MSQKKLMIGLPMALLLGGSAIAIGVVPGVRDWIDNTVPWLGINGPKSTDSIPKNVLLASEKISAERLAAENLAAEQITAEKKYLLPQRVETLEVESPASEDASPRYDVQFATATVPVPQSPSAQGNDLQKNASNRFAQAPSIGVVPPSGINVPSSGIGKLIVEHAQVFFFEESFVAAQAEGIIMRLMVDDGSMIKAGEPMIEIDQRLAEKEVAVSDQELAAARLKASDDSNLKYSQSALEVAAMEVKISREMQEKGAEGLMEGEKKKLEYKKAGYQVDVSTIEKKRDAADVGVKTAKLEAAKVQIDLRKITAQRTGMVSEIEKRQFDWVRAGEKILRLTSMEKLRIKGYAEVFDSPHLLLNAPARVTIEYAKDKPETVDGSVSYVAPRSVSANRYQIYVDLPNRMTSDGQFLFREGMEAKIEIMPRSR